MSGFFSFTNTDKYRFAMEQGATFEYTVQLTNDSGTAVNLTGYSAKMQVRLTPDSETALLSLTSPSGGIVITPATGLITLTAAASVTEDMPVGKFYYDITITSGSYVDRVLEGFFEVTPAISR
jgi:hypothetical protein